MISTGASTGPWIEIDWDIRQTVRPDMGRDIDQKGNALLPDEFRPGGEAGAACSRAT
ncbi:MAG TPA: hypothetical protein VGE08_10500 [Steroidobacter sp.]|uniref:hypothetical protein n=1 Tax=Steroidobacter sp. TaxID=1978227 RepID=UPI002ED90BAF